MSSTAGGVRGRDFVSYRIAGAISALVFLVLLAWAVFEIFDGDGFVRPEVAMQAAGTQGEAIDQRNQGGTLTSEVLTARTKLQDERFRNGPAPEADAPDLAGGDARIVSTPLEDGTSLTSAWSVPSEDEAAMMQAAGRTEGLSSLPYANAALYERPAARDWRVGLSDFITHLGAIAILGMAFLLSAVLALRGRVPIRQGKSGRTVKRFGLLERATHWMTSVSFLGLAFTGIVIAYGETLFVPLGARAMGTLGWWSTWGHVLFAPTFFLGILVMIVMWTHRNLPSKLDITWIAKGGGFFSDDGDHPPAKKFNAGQKIIFWSAVLGGLALVATGVTLMFPYYFLGIEGMSWAMLIHAGLAVLMIAVFLGHIYIGSIGMHGAIDAMWSGKVDRNWAEEHHSIWLKEIDTQRSPAE